MTHCDGCEYYRHAEHYPYFIDNGNEKGFATAFLCTNQTLISAMFPNSSSKSTLIGKVFQACGGKFKNSSEIPKGWKPPVVKQKEKPKTVKWKESTGQIQLHCPETPGSGVEATHDDVPVRSINDSSTESNEVTDW